MRRTYISPEFDYKQIWGTYNMKEESTFFSSKMLEIEDVISLHDQSLVYFQKANKEQLDLAIEQSLPSQSYSTSDNKRENHTIEIDPSQSTLQKDTRCRYIMRIDLATIITEHVFALLKRYRTFEGVRNSMTRTGDVDFSIREYVQKNVLDRYRLREVRLYLKYNPLNSQSILKFNNVWSGFTDSTTNRTAILPSDIVQDQYRLRNIETETEYDQSATTVRFAQQEEARKSNFDYYFILDIEKI